jgi:serine/threonine protein kinase
MLRIQNSKHKTLAIGHYKIIDILYNDKRKDIYHVKDMRKPYCEFTLRILKLDQSPSQIDKEIEILNILNQYDEMLHFYDVQILSDKLLFLFDYAKGYNIKQIIQKNSKFFYNGKIKQFVINMAYILAVYQKYNIIHGNINAQNIIFNGKNFYLIGLSKAFIDLDSTIGNDNDIYSFGLMLHYIIFGKEYKDDHKIDMNIDMDRNILYILNGMLEKDLKNRIKLHEIVNILMH